MINVDKTRRNNAIYITFLSLSIVILAVIIAIPAVRSMRYNRHSVDYNSIISMGSYHIKISNATYLKDTKELYFFLSTKEQNNSYNGSKSTKPELSKYTLRYTDNKGKYHTEDMMKKYTVSEKNDMTEVITVADIPSDYDYAYIELQCTVAAYDDPDTVDEFGDVVKGQHHDEVVLEQYFMFDKKDIRVINSKDDNQDNVSVAIDESISDSENTTKVNTSYRNNDNKKADFKTDNSSLFDSSPDSKSDSKSEKREKKADSSAAETTTTKAVETASPVTQPTQDNQSPSTENRNDNNYTYTETHTEYHPEPIQTELPYQPPATTTAVVKARSLKIETNYEYNDVKINVGSSAQLTAVVGPSNAIDKSVTWESNRPDIAEVDSSGNVRGISSGKAIITVRISDNSAITASCMVTVS